MPPSAADPKAKRRPATADEGRDTANPAAKPHGTTTDQIATMESEGQGQPQADERDRPERGRVRRD